MIYFLSILENEFVKIGFTEQKVEKRRSALQTGNPHEIKVLFSIDGSLSEEKEIHRELKEVFERVKVFNNPVNEWYPGNNPIIKKFISNVQSDGIVAALKNLKSITHWLSDVGDGQAFTIRNLERALRNNGFSRAAAKHLIWESKTDFITLWEKCKPPDSGERNRPRVILRKGPQWIGRAVAVSGPSL